MPHDLGGRKSKFGPVQKEQGSRIPLCWLHLPHTVTRSNHCRQQLLPASEYVAFTTLVHWISLSPTTRFESHNLSTACLPMCVRSQLDVAVSRVSNGAY